MIYFEWDSKEVRLAKEKVVELEKKKKKILAQLEIAKQELILAKTDATK